MMAHFTLLPGRLRHWIASIAFSTLLAFNTTAAAAPMKVVFLAPDPPGNLFWGKVMDFMKAVGDDLDVDLKIEVSVGASSYKMKRDGLKIINRSDKPDYILTGYWTGATDKLIEAGAEENIRFFLFNTGIQAAEQRLVGKPRQQYPNWIGHLMPDDVKAGYELADILARYAKELKRNRNNPTIKIAGLNGTADSAVSTERRSGLTKKVAGDPLLEMTDVLDTSWNRTTGHKAAEVLLNEHPDISIIWTVADALALGTIDALKDKGLEPGVDVVTGGIDWSDKGIQAVKRGEMAATMGGHFMDGGWALILAYDYHNGHDFADELGTSSVTQMQAITRDNVDTYIEKLGHQNWEKIDFKQFSKTHNKNLKQYDFSLDALLKNIDRSTGSDQVAAEIEDR